MRFISGLKPFQFLVLGFLSYVVIGTAFLSLPISQVTWVSTMDNLFNVTSAVSTTGLSTVGVSDSYTLFGQIVILVLFQLGGIGYMTLTSFIILARGRQLSELRNGVLGTEFSLPAEFKIHSFIFQVAVFTLTIELIGTMILFMEFRSAGVDSPFWMALFHAVSAFTTSGFSTFSNSMESFKGNWVICVTVGALCYMGSIGFIVLHDAFLAIKSKAYRITFTSKVILVITALIFFVCAPLFYLSEPSLRSTGFSEGVLISAFQIMTASSTAGFNTVSIGGLAPASLTLLIIAMVIGASPSGTGGGIKTTSVSSCIGIVVSILRGRSSVTFFGHSIPNVRLMTAVASVSVYLAVLAAGVFMLSITEKQEYIKLVFEAASALGTVGLSMGITGELSGAGKMIITFLMFAGRVGPLTIGLSLFHSAKEAGKPKKSDLAV
ncbi:potassium transporter KtrB [Geovibrio thiophilus]|uniref:Potassium transporter KtrB n=1 Tax=Geovibrio thiophilus TaxID=139438 RepID=A0A410JVU9_9BACT|nr:potassium transporter TrkG [Geovibrio thiophilus]QAR32316.1 potassium transporter KtrB [Geovibrio thiophilus]